MTTTARRSLIRWGPSAASLRRSSIMPSGHTSGPRLATFLFPTCRGVACVGGSRDSLCTALCGRRPANLAEDTTSETGRPASTITSAAVFASPVNFFSHPQQSSPNQISFSVGLSIFEMCIVPLPASPFLWIGKKIARDFKHSAPWSVAHIRPGNSLGHHCVGRQQVFVFFPCEQLSVRIKFMNQ